MKSIRKRRRREFCTWLADSEIVFAICILAYSSNCFPYLPSEGWICNTASSIGNFWLNLIHLVLQGTRKGHVCLSHNNKLVTTIRVGSICKTKRKRESKIFIGTVLHYCLFRTTVRFSFLFARFSSKVAAFRLPHVAVSIGEWMKGNHGAAMAAPPILSLRNYLRRSDWADGSRKCNNLITLDGALSPRLLNKKTNDVFCSILFRRRI